MIDHKAEDNSSMMLISPKLSFATGKNGSRAGVAGRAN